MKQTVYFYFDPVSPYSWLAAERFDAVEDAGGHIVCRPVLFAGLLKAHGTLGPAEVPAKRAYVFRDVMRQAARFGLAFRGPPTHPFNPLPALRAGHAIKDDKARQVYVQALLRAVWREGADVTVPEVLGDILRSSGLEPGPVLEAIRSEEIKQALAKAGQDALEAGIFGVPSFIVGHELFWGSDRIDSLIWVLRGGRVD